VGVVEWARVGESIHIRMGAGRDDDLADGVVEIVSVVAGDAANSNDLSDLFQPGAVPKKP
jgi:hypothetical protein